MSSDTILLEYDGPVAIVTNNRPVKHNAANDEMDLRLWEVLGEIHANPEVRCVLWRGVGTSVSSGRDTTELGIRSEDISDFDFIERGHKGAQQFFSMPCPILVALHGWTIGGSFERALLCDMRIASESARMMLPEVKHGVVPDSGGTARLFQIAGHGLTADLALTGRVLDAQEALQHGIVSRVLPDDQLESAGLEIAREIAAMPPFTVKMFLRTLRRLANPPVQASMQEEAVSQSMVFASEDYAELKSARAAKREPVFRGR